MSRQHYNRRVAPADPNLRLLSHVLTASATWFRLACLGVLLTMLAGVGIAQTTSTVSSTDGRTPSGMQTGTPAGSYALSGFDSISPFSGGLSFRLPLLSIGGRGGAGYTVTLPIEKKWRVEHTTSDPNVYCAGCEIYEATHTYSPTDQPWGITPGYGAGVLQGRQTGKEPIACGGGPTVYSETVTRLTFTAPDGTEFELRDQLHGGKPLPTQLPCGTNPTRGTVFITADGTSATFISDAPLHDLSFVYDSTPIYPSGYLLMRDGTRYRINNGHVEWIQDRQGNRVTIGAVGSQTLITDSLGRQVTISYANLPSVPYDEFTFAGVGGATRRIRVHYASLSSRLRTGYSINTYSGLFGALGGNNNSNYDPPVVSSVELPDGRTYNFSYNSHGELARVELPTGGAFEYDFQLSDGVIDLGIWSRGAFGPATEYDIYRRVERKRVYESGGALESRTEFSLTEESTYSNTVALAAFYDKSGNLLAADKHYYYGSAYPYLASYTKPTHYTAWSEGKEYKTEALDADGVTVLRRSEHTWQQRAPVSWWNINYGPEPANDPRLIQSVTTLVDSGQVTKQTFAYDGFNNQTDVWEYDYGAGAPPPHPMRHTHTDYLTTNPVNTIDYTSQTGAHIRNLPRAQTVYSVNPSTGVESPTPVARSVTRYDEYPLLNCDGTGCGGAVQWIDPGTARGNVTTARSWLDTNNTWLENRVEYDQLGNVRKTWDARTDKTEAERVTEIKYSAAYKHAYPTYTKSPVPDPTGDRATSTSLESWTVYDLSTGKVTSTTDANNKTTSYQYNDVLDRLTRVDSPDGGWNTYEYSCATCGNYVKAKSAINATQNTESQQFSDGLGRPVRGFLYDGTVSTPWSVTDTYYDAMGRVAKKSNAYRVAEPSAVVPETCAACTTSAFDALGRVKTVTTPDNAQITTTYSGNTVTVTDQVGKRRKSVTDALGRLTTVHEDPNVTGYTGLDYQTTYSYDVLGNLRKVDQGGQLRFYMYDSLGRLVRAKNPEQGTFTTDSDFPALTDATSGTGNSQWSTGYTYDANGNLFKRKDARNITTTHLYDNINRLIRTNYSDGTPYTQRTYDNAATNGRGRAYSSLESSAEGTKNYVTDYDEMGRPTAGKTEFYAGGALQNTYTYSRKYDKMGHVTEQTYPSERKVYYPLYDAAGRLKKFTGNLGDGIQRTYATGVNPENGLEEGIQYDEAGRIRQEKFGTQTPLFHQRGYNVRGQMCKVALGTSATSLNRGLLLFYYSQVNGYSGCASGTDNNGNMVLSQHWVPNDEQISGWQWFNQYYTYDSLNRISSVREEQNAAVTTGEQHYTYDRWGNRKINAATTYNNNPSLPFNEKQFDERALATKNRLHAPGDLDTGKPESDKLMRYDAAGNLTVDRYTGMGARTYDPENRMTSAVSDIYGNSSVYTYDADGRRTRRHMPTGNVWQVYGLGGELLAEYAAGAPSSAPRKEYGYRNGELLVTAEVTSAASSAVPSNLLAAPTNAGAQVTLGWSEVAGATKYRVERATVKQGPFSLRGTVEQTTGFVDTQVTSGQAYLYRVCAADAAGNCTSGYGNLALATAYGFADDPLITLADDPTGVTATPISALHITQLRTAVDGVRVLTGLGAASWGQAVTAGVWIRAAHVEELRERLREALVELSLPTPSYTDATLSVDVTAIKRVHISELRLRATRASGAAPSGGAGGGVNIQWLVADHLGTPRMIANLSGDLAGPTGIKRHDYLPFGEELFAGTGGRTTGQGYSGDNVRQQFTGYERDDETGLDYAQARYFSSTQGRFTSPDPVAGSQINPQSLNRYAYVLNNPLRYTDPSGLTAQDGTLRDQGGRAWGTCGVSSNCLGELTSPITVTATYDFPIILEEITNQLSTAVSITPTIPLPSESFAGARLALDGIGMAPGFGEPFNIASGILGYLDGDYAGGTLSMMSAIPGLGNVTGVGAMGRAASQLDNVAGVADDAVGATRRAPNFIAPESGPAIIVPNGATGPIPAINGKGFRYTDGSGGHGLDLRTTDVRIMDPTSRYPNGYGSYSNSAGQTVNPYSGRTIAPSNPWWHIPRR